MKPQPLEQPASGHHRIACGESCDVTIGGQRRQGMIWNLSVVGVYLVMATPLPAAGESLLLTFTLPGDPHADHLPGPHPLAQSAVDLPGLRPEQDRPAPGCGIEFTVLDTRDAERIAARVKATAPPADARPRPLPAIDLPRRTL